MATLNVIQSDFSKSGKSYWALVAEVTTKQIDGKNVAFASNKRFWLKPDQLLPVGTELDSEEFEGFLQPVQEEFDEIVERRKAVRVFDEHTDVTDAVRRGLSRAVLSPNSSNMQLWEFHQVRDRQTHERITKACLKQSAARTANQLVVVVCRQDKWRERVKWNLAQLKEQFKDKAELTSRDKRALQYYRMLMPLMYRNDPFGFWRTVRTVLRTYLLLKGPSLRMVSHADQRVMLHKSAAIAAQTFMLSMAAEGLDTCPMEGFDEVRIKKALGLPGAAEICMVIGCGKGKAEGVYSQRRRVAESEVIFSR